MISNTVHRSGLVLAFIYLLSLYIPHVSTAAAQAVEQPCHPSAIATLKQLSPHGYAVYAAYPDKADFKQWISDCSDPISGLNTAVHETVHMLTDRQGAYPLVGGGSAARVSESPDFFPPAELANRFPPSSPFVENYLTRGGASSADYFRYLLDEFNAYAHDLNTATRLKHLEPRNNITAHRDGLAAFMAFVSAYATTAKQEYPQTWRALLRPDVRETIYTLWAQAEDVMGNSCHVRDIANEAPAYLSQVCRVNILHPLSTLLGRPPLCPVRCLR